MWNFIYQYASPVIISVAFQCYMLHCSHFTFTLPDICESKLKKCWKQKSQTARNELELCFYRARKPDWKRLSLKFLYNKPTPSPLSKSTEIKQNWPVVGPLKATPPTGPTNIRTSVDHLEAKEDSLCVEGWQQPPNQSPVNAFCSCKPKTVAEMFPNYTDNPLQKSTKQQRS